MADVPAAPAPGHPAFWRGPMRALRRLYDWTLHWADTPHGPTALFVLAFAEASFFPVPPDVLLIALALGAPRRSFRFAAVCAAGSVLGGMAGWAIGAGLWHAVDDFLFDVVPGFTPETFAYVQGKYRDNAALALLIAAFTPIPYKVFTVAAGVFGVPIVTLIWASVVGRSARFFAVAALIFLFGPPVKRFIDRWFDWLAIAFTVLLIGGFVALKAV